MAKETKGYEDIEVEDPRTMQVAGEVEKTPKCAIFTTLLPLKFIVFLLYGGMAALYPFFSLHMKSIGMNITETAIITCLLPILSCIVVPCISMLADRIRHYKLILVILTLGQVLCHLFLLIIPSFQFHESPSDTNQRNIDITDPCYNNKSTSSAMLCESRGQRKDDNTWLILILYFLLRLLGMIGMFSVIVILNTVTMQLVKQNAVTSFVLNLVFACLAFVVFPVLSGFLISSGLWEPGANFTPAFILFGCLSGLAAVMLLCMNVPTSVPQNIWKNLGKVLMNPQVAAMIIVMIMIGMAVGYGSFLYWFLEVEFSFTTRELGLGGALSKILAIPLFFIAKCVTCIGFVRHENLLALALFLNGLRFLAYSYLTEWYLYFPIELLTAVTIAIVFTIPALYSQVIARDYVKKEVNTAEEEKNLTSLLATLQTLLIAATFGLGAGLGPLIGGATIWNYGHRKSLRIFAILFLIVAVIYFLAYLCFLRKIKPVAEKSTTSTGCCGCLKKSEHLPGKDVENKEESRALS